MGKKKRKSGHDSKIDVFQLNKNEKRFLYKKFMETKSVGDVQKEFVKVFPMSCIPTQKFIHKMYVLFQKDKYRNKSDPGSVAVINNNTLKQAKNVALTLADVARTNFNNGSSNSHQTIPGTNCIGNINKRKKKKKKNKKGKTKENNNCGNIAQVPDSTVQENGSSQNDVNRITSDNKINSQPLIQQSCDVNNSNQGFNKIINKVDNSSVDISVKDNHQKKEEKIMQMPIDVIDLGNDTDDSIFSNTTVIQRLPENNSEDVAYYVCQCEPLKHVSSSVSVGAQSTTILNIQHDVSSIFRKLKTKRRRRYKKNLTDVTRNIQKNNIQNEVSRTFQTIRLRTKRNLQSQKGRVSFENTNKENDIQQNVTIKNDLFNFPHLPEPSCSKINALQYPESSTPYKTVQSNFNNKISMSPIQTTLQQSINGVVPDAVEKFETILEISDDEGKDKIEDGFVTVDKTGFLVDISTKDAEIIISLDDTGTEDNQTVSLDEITSDGNTTVIERKSPDSSTLTNIDLTQHEESFSDVVKKNSDKQLHLDVCYDLTADDADVSLNSLDRKRQSLLNALAQSVTGNCYKPVTNKKSRNFGSNIYNPLATSETVRRGLRMIVIDGSNVAMSHGMRKNFSVEGLQICIDYFLKRGHEVKAFVPRFRCKMNKSSNPRLLNRLEEVGHVVFTPSRQIQGKHITCYDDRFIVQCAAEYGGVIVSGDNYRDLLQENPSWRQTIEERLLNFTWVGNLLMFPQDPLGRGGPDLKTFLSHPESST